MDLPVGKQSKEFWLKHIEAFNHFPGSLAAYCRQNGLVVSRFNYHRSQQLKNKFSEVKPVERNSSQEPRKEAPSYPPRLPDPKWIASLIRELCR